MSKTPAEIWNAMTENNRTGVLNLLLPDNDQKRTSLFALACKNFSQLPVYVRVSFAERVAGIKAA